MALRGQEQDHTSPESPSAVGGGGAHARSHGHHHNHHGGNARQKAVDEAELKQTHQALSVLLSDATAFDAAVDGIFRCMDTSADDEVDAEELMAYVQEASAGLGLPRPQPGQVQGVFRQLDLNSDKSISRDELAVFLRHLFQQQVKQLAARGAAK